MFIALVLTLREAVEAALIISILISLVNKTRMRHGTYYIYGGAFVAIAISALVAVLFSELYQSFSTSMEGIAGLLAVALLTYMVFWMQEQARDLQGRLKERAKSALTAGQIWGFSLLTFLSVLREGIETILFLISAGKTTPSVQVFAGAGIGIFIALLLAVFLFRGLVRVNMHRFFTWTAYLLVIFGAGMLGQATAALQAAGWLPGTITAWNSSGLLAESSALGAFLSGLMGYSENPTILQIYVYLGYLVTALYLFSAKSGRLRENAAREYNGPFHSIGGDYSQQLYRLLRRPWFPHLSMMIMALVFLALLVIGYFNFPVGPFDGQGTIA